MSSAAWQDHAEWYDWSAAQLRAQAQVHELAINPIIYAELALNYESIETLDARVAFIGAHAAVLDCTLLTRDAARYRSYFPTVELLTPQN